MKRRRFLGAGALGLAAAAASASASPANEGYQPPPRFVRPDVASDEGGLWALMDREETRMRRSPFILRNAAVQAYVQSIACKLASAHCPDLRVYIVRSPFFNASMAPSGLMQVWTGLLLRVENEAQLAAVIAHEIGHYYERHTLERMRDAKSRSAFASFMGLFGVIGLVGSLAAVAGAYGFSRDQERAADRIGLDLMRAAGYDAREMARIWSATKEENAASYGGANSPNPLLATHPGIEERSTILAQLAAADTGGFKGQEEYAQQMAPLQSLMLEDELKRGQYGQSIVLLDRLVSLNPARGDLLFYRGEARRLRAAEGDLPKALADFEQAISTGNAPSVVYRSLGQLYQATERGAEARQSFTRYVEAAPDAPDAAMIKNQLEQMQ